MSKNVRVGVGYAWECVCLAGNWQHMTNKQGCAARQLDLEKGRAGGRRVQGLSKVPFN